MNNPIVEKKWNPNVEDFDVTDPIVEKGSTVERSDVSNIGAEVVIEFFTESSEMVNLIVGNPHV